MSEPAGAPLANHAGMDITPLATHIGAEIGGVDLSQPLSPAQVTGIRSALLQWKVVFFRDQHLDHAQHIHFARQFGTPTPGHVVFGGDPGFPEIYSVAKFRTANAKRLEETRRPWSGWHTDITAAINPPCASILRGVTVPPYGGDTQWTNLVTAYRALSPPLQRFVDGLRGHHRFDPPLGTTGTRDYDEIVRRHAMESMHPLVCVHPETGERALYVSPGFLKRIADVSPQESLHLLEMLWEHIVRPEFTVRFRWEPGSIAFWDNRSTAHLAPRDIFDSGFDRQLFRVTLMGEVPVGVDGEPSTPITGEPIQPIA